MMQTNSASTDEDMIKKEKDARDRTRREWGELFASALLAVDHPIHPDMVQRFLADGAAAIMTTARLSAPRSSITWRGRMSRPKLYGCHKIFHVTPSCSQFR